jgi:hypothetical protein
MGLTLGIGMPQLHASAPSQPSTIANPNSHKHDIILSSLPQEQPPMAHKESERFSSTQKKLPDLPDKVFPTFCLVIDLIMSEDHHSHGPTGELCGCMTGD